MDWKKILVTSVKIFSLFGQSFGREVQEQTPKMEAVIQAGRSGLLDVQWPLGTPGWHDDHY